MGTEGSLTSTEEKRRCAMTESRKIDDDMLTQLADGQNVYLAERRAAQREHPIFEEIREMIVDTANRYADPESVRKALPRLNKLLKKLQSARALSDSDLRRAYAQHAAVRDELKLRLMKGELSEHVVDALLRK